MRKFHSDCWGNLHDHNGRIGISTQSGVQHAVVILNEQQAEIARLRADLAAAREEARAGDVERQRLAVSLEKVQNIARAQLDTMTARISAARLAGAKAANKDLERCMEALKAEKEARAKDNADLTEQILAAESAKLPQPSAPILCTFPSCDTARALDVAQRAGMMRAAEIAEVFTAPYDLIGYRVQASGITAQEIADAIRAEAQREKI